MMFRIFDKSRAKAFVLIAGLSLVTLQLAGCGSREERAKSYYDNGMSYLEKKDYIKARIEFRNAVQSKDNMVEAWRGLAQIDDHDRNIPSLIGDLRRVVELDPKDVNSQTRLARLLLLAGAVDQALKTTNTALELDPQKASILALKAAVLFRLKDNEGSLQAAQKSLQIEPGNTDASIVIAAQRFSQGDTDGALKALANVTNAHAEDLGVLLLNTSIFERMGNLVQTEALLRKIIELYPKEPAFRAQLIRFFVANKRIDDAVKEQRSVVAANPDDINAELGLVNLLGTLKGPAAARAELVGRINAGGKVFPYQVALAKLDFAQGHVADSTKLLGELIHSKIPPEEILTARVTLAEMYLSKNDIAAAEPLISDILGADARNVDGLRLRASIRIERGQIDDAIGDLRMALNEQPKSPVLLAGLALAYERSGSIDLADKALFDATKASGYAPVVGLNYVAFLRRRGLGDQAEKVIADLAARNPNNIPVLSALAQVKLVHQDWAGAHDVANAIHRLDEKNELANQINGAAFSGEKKYNESIAALQHVYDANPGVAQAMADMVRVYLQTKQINKAEDLVKEALKANPANADALVMMGTIALAKNDQKQAVANFENAIKQQPKNIVGYRVLAEVYLRQNKIDEALKIVRAGLEQQPKSFALRLALAGMLETKGEFDPAIAEYETMLKDQPGSMIVVNNLASLLADHRTDKASLERANSLAVILNKSQVPQFKDTLGWIAYKRGDYAAAAPLLETAAAQLSNVATVRYHLGMLYFATGQDVKASEQLSKARELAPNDADLKIKIDAALKSHPEKVKG